MNKTDLQRYQESLLAMKDRLTGDILSIVDTIRVDAQAAGERDWPVSESPEKELMIESAEEGLHQRVVEALERIEDGTYGKCQECGQSIGKARLSAVPYTLFCIRCERQLEAALPR